MNSVEKNPIDRNHIGPITKQQARAYNLLLTRLSNLLIKLTVKSETDTQDSKNRQAIECWQVLLNDLTDVVLPEFYVVFHDETTDIKQRRRLYDITQAIFFTFSYYDSTGFLPYLEQDNQDRIIKQIIENKPLFIDEERDSYITGKGPHASVAYELLQIAEYVEVNGQSYIDYFIPYYNLLIVESDLRVCLLNSSVQGIKQQLKGWQKKRLLAFSIPSLSTIVKSPTLVNADISHALADWVLQDYIGSKIHLAKTNNSAVSADNYALTTTNNSSSPNMLSVTWKRIKNWFIGGNNPKTSNSEQSTKSVKPTESDAYFMPLSSKRHAAHLSILLTAKPTSRLKQLIEATNVLYGHLDYLKQAHPYLATSVEESIKDLTYNTILRLDETASQFVKDGEVSPDVRDLFKKQHEARIDRLISLNLAQVKDLNKTILEKKMAGFASVGNEREHQFRQTIMELKILLRWLIAQQPDEMQATNYQVILSNLEATTLSDMQAIFFATQTTCDQRQALQQQLENLLNHFKQQTDLNHMQYAVEDESEMNLLLKLTRPNTRTPLEANKEKDVGSKLDSVNRQLEADSFIEYNKHYIDQLLKHWS